VKVDEQHPIWYVLTGWPIQGPKRSQGLEDVRQLGNIIMRLEN